MPGCIIEMLYVSDGMARPSSSLLPAAPQPEQWFPSHGGSHIASTARTTHIGLCCPASYRLCTLDNYWEVSLPQYLSGKRAPRPMIWTYSGRCNLFLAPNTSVCYLPQPSPQSVLIEIISQVISRPLYLTYPPSLGRDVILSPVSESESFLDLIRINLTVWSITG